MSSSRIILPHSTCLSFAAEGLQIRNSVSSEPPKAPLRPKRGLHGIAATGPQAHAVALQLQRPEVNRLA